MRFMLLTLVYGMGVIVFRLYCAEMEDEEKCTNIVNAVVVYFK